MSIFLPDDGGLVFKQDNKSTNCGAKTDNI